MCFMYNDKPCWFKNVKVLKSCRGVMSDLNKIHLGVFTTNIEGKHNPSTEEIIQAAKRRPDVEVDVFYPSDVSLQTDSEGAHFWLRNKKYKKPPFDIVLPRVGSRFWTDEVAADLKQLEIMGTPVLNNAEVIDNADDKWKCHQILAQNKIPQPLTYYAPRALNAAQLQSLDGNKNKVVIKEVRGSGGKGVYFTESGLVNEKLNNKRIAQKFEDKEIGVDYRYYVMNGKVIFAINRSATKAGEYRSNICLGGKDQEIVPDPFFSKLAVQATNALGLELAGVDIVRSDTGTPVVLEVNGCPDFPRADGKRFSVNMADKIVDAALKKEEQALPKKFNMIA